MVMEARPGRERCDCIICDQAAGFWEMKYEGQEALDGVAMLQEDIAGDRHGAVVRARREE